MISGFDNNQKKRKIFIMNRIIYMNSIYIFRFNIGKSLKNINIRNVHKTCGVLTNFAKRSFSREKLLKSEKLYLALSLSFFGFSSNDNVDTPEDKLVAAIKRSILCIQREQYDKAEQMLHLALRMAQDLQNKDGITYVYDVMANLAMEREQFKKAEKLFTDVMIRLLGDGFPDDSPKILHISSKLAHMSQLQGELDKAKIGFIWTLQKIEECMKKMPDDVDIKELWGLTTNWFGQLYMKQENYEEARKCFKKAYDCYIKIHGTANEAAIIILNDLSVACVNMEKFAEAKLYTMEALNLVKDIKDATQEGVLRANLGLIYLREGLINEAKNSCSQAWKTGKLHKNNAAIEQAEYCLNEIKTYQINT